MRDALTDNQQTKRIYKKFSDLVWKHYPNQEALAVLHSIRTKMPCHFVRMMHAAEHNWGHRGRNR